MVVLPESTKTWRALKWPVSTQQTSFKDVLVGVDPQRNPGMIVFPVAETDGAGRCGKLIETQGVEQAATLAGGTLHKGKGRKGGIRKERPTVNVEHLKSLNRGEAYDKIRKIVGPRRLDPAGKIIPGPEDKPFNFVTAKGSIGRLYLSDEVAKELSNGNAAISAFMSHHGLAHCVLPVDIALDLAKVFPLWLRFLHGSEEAGKLESELAAEEPPAQNETPAGDEAAAAVEAPAEEVASPAPQSQD